MRKGLRHHLKKHILFKLALITTTVFSLMLAVFFLSQVLFLEKFFVHTKVSGVKAAMEDFQTQYLSKTWTAQEITDQLNVFASKQGAQAAILDAGGQIKYTTVYEVVLKTDLYGDVTIPLNSILYLDGFESMTLRPGEAISLDCIFDEANRQVLSITRISRGAQVWANVNAGAGDFTVMSRVSNFTAASAAPSIQKVEVSSAPEAEAPILTIKPATVTTLPQLGTTVTASDAVTNHVELLTLATTTLSGHIVSSNLPETVDQMASYANSLLWTAIDRWNWKRLSDKSPAGEALTEFQYTSPLTGMDSRVMVAEYSTASGKEWFFVNLPLRPVDDAVAAVKNYYLFAFLFALLPVALLSVLYSKLITKPLLQINQTAVKLADMDFSERCQVSSEDEIGTLAQSLNHMSDRLFESMTELQTANEQLLLDIEKEKSLERMRKDFIASVSHEFKTPLGIIRAYTEGLSLSQSEEKRRYYSHVVMEEVERMDDLVLDLLELARLESGASTLEMEQFSIQELSDSVCSRFKQVAQESGIDLTDACQPIEVLGDWRKLDQVLTNLLSNALRHTPPGGLVTLSTRVLQDSLEVRVANTGSSIPTQDLERIWDRFYRVEKSRVKGTGGTGLGLSIVRHILELHHSHYGVENTETGVVFYFSLNLDSPH